MSDKHILVIGSNRRFYEKIKGFLSGAEYSIEYSDDIPQASQPVENGEYEILIAEISGVSETVSNRIEQLAQLDTTGKIIVVTDRKNKIKASEALGDHVWAYLQKPVTENEFKAAANSIDSYIRLSREVSTASIHIAHLEVINNIARESLFNDDRESLLWYICREIHEKLGFFNVNIFEIDDKLEHAVLKAFAGGFGDDFYAGYSLKIGEGMVGWTALKRESQLTGDAKNFPHRIQGFSFEENIQSELAVPIMFEDRVLGVLHVESVERDAFTRDDLTVLDTLADQISLAFEKTRLSRKLLETYELGSVINDTLPVSILILNKDLMIEYVNRSFCEITNRRKEDSLNQTVDYVFPQDILQTIDVNQELKYVLESGEPVYHNFIRHTSPDYPEKVLNLSFIRLRDGEFPLAMILIRDITENTRKTYQLSLIREISIAMQGVLDRDKLLHLILTCVTAGFAIGYNRAFIFLVDESCNELRGYMGVGPQSHDEAYRIWAELSQKQFTLQEYMAKIQNGDIERSAIRDLIENMAFNLDITDNILTETVSSGRYIHVINAWNNPAVDESMRMFVADEFITIPLIARNRVIGVLLADNAYSGREITPDSIEVLTMFAAHAGIAIENARILLDLEDKVKELQGAYIELEKTHDMLVRNEKLAAVGEVSARIAHEIRNPLSTIGGFAKSILKKYDDRDRTFRNVEIIVEEVERLETILSNILDFTKPSVPVKTLSNINNLIEETLAFMETNVSSKNIAITLDLSDEPLESELDSSQIKQVLINILQNSISALDGEGSIEIKTASDGNEVSIEVKDTGVGIPEQYLDNLFEPFFTTRGAGTGLGLAISNRIIQNHQGRIEISSRENEGTSVRVILPLLT